MDFMGSPPPGVAFFTGSDPVTSNPVSYFMVPGGRLLAVTSFVLPEPQAGLLLVAGVAVLVAARAMQRRPR